VTHLDFPVHGEVRELLVAGEAARVDDDHHHAIARHVIEGRHVGGRGAAGDLPGPKPRVKGPPLTCLYRKKG
jgi:hypothetical protein